MAFYMAKRCALTVALLFVFSFHVQAITDQSENKVEKQTNPAPSPAAIAGKTDKGKTDKGKTDKGETDKGEEDKNDKDKNSNWWLVLIYALCVVVPLLAIHLHDSYKAYGGSRYVKKLLGKLKSDASSQDIINLIRELRVIQNRPVGIPGTTRSIFSYLLLLILAIAIFHLLAISSSDQSLAIADKTIAVLSGAVATIIGFYFGAKATSEAPKAQPETPAQTPPGQIASITPPSAAAGEKITIKGQGFGSERGSVKLASVNVPDADIEQWSDSCITLKVPQACRSGKTLIIVNPTHAKAVSTPEDNFQVV